MSQDHTRLPPTRGEGQGQTADVSDDFEAAEGSMSKPTFLRIVRRYGDFVLIEFDLNKRQKRRRLLKVATLPGGAPLDIWDFYRLRLAAGQSLTEASVYGSSPLINEAQPLPPGGNSHEG